MNWCGFCCHHVPRWKALDPSYFATTYLMVFWCAECDIFANLWKKWFTKISQISKFLFKIHENGFLRTWKSKNRHLRTFGTIKIVSRVVRVPRLILRVPLDPKTSSKAKFEFWRHLKIFFASCNSNLHVLSRAVFDASEAIFTKNLQNHEKIATSARLSGLKWIGAISVVTKHLVGKLWT